MITQPPGRRAFPSKLRQVNPLALVKNNPFREQQLALFLGGVLLCWWAEAAGNPIHHKLGVAAAGPCVQEWTSRFFYTDENGKRDAFMVTWKQMVFSGMTPTGGLCVSS